MIVAPNLGWRNFPLRDSIAERLELPATLDNDANCATVGEWWQGAAQGATNVVGMTIGTGIGGGLILDGVLYHGSSDVAGEIGHTTIDLNGPPLQVRQLRLPRGVRVRARRSRRARARCSCAKNGVAAAAAWWTASSTSITAADGVRRGERRATRSRIEIVRDTARYPRRRHRATCSTSSTRTSS